MLDNGILKDSIALFKKITSSSYKFFCISKVKTITIITVAVLLSTTINSYLRPIQQQLHNGINYAYDINETIGETLYEINGILFNGKNFDAERKGKRVIYDSYGSVVIVTVKSDDQVANKTMAGRGTGFFIEVTDEYALIATNHHVIDGWIKDKAFKISIGTATEMWPYEVEVIGHDQVADVAVLKIFKLDNEDWKALEWATQESIAVGDPVVVIGHGMSMPWTSTQGHVVYKDRYGSRPYSLMLQVDAVINQGNSGGPVIDLEGKVVGIAQSIYSPGRQIPGWDGIGMAIPVKQAKRSIDYILSPRYIAKGYVPYAEFPFMLGTFKFEDVQDLPRKDRRFAYINYPEIALGADLTEVSTVGELAGFLQGDIILKVNGVDAMSSFYVMRETIYAFPGDIWTVEFKRDGEVMTKKIALREMDRTQLIKTLNLRAK
jgi:serine protease Do